MEWTAVIPAACGAILGGGLSLLGSSWQASRSAVRQRKVEVRKRSEDSAAEAMAILHDIRRTAETHPDRGWPGFGLSIKGINLLDARVVDLKRSARLITNLELRDRINSAAAYLSAPQEFQHLEEEAIGVTTQRLETWISDNVTAYLTDVALPVPPVHIKSYEASYQEACSMADESWKAEEQWRKEERERLRKERNEKSG